MKHGNTVQEPVNKAAIILETKVLEYLSTKEVIRGLVVASRDCHDTVKDDTELVMSLISYDFGDIFEEYEELKKQFLSHEISSFQCIRLLYSQFETLRDLKVPNYHLASSSVINALLDEHPGSSRWPLDTDDDEESDSSSNEVANTSKTIETVTATATGTATPMATNQKVSDDLVKRWDFTHLIGLKKSGCVLHWLLYVQRLYALSEHPQFPCEMTCDHNGIVQIQPMDSPKQSNIEYEGQELLQENETIAKPPRKKIVLSGALDLWNLCWKTGFTPKELAKLQQGLTQFAFRRW